MKPKLSVIRGDDENGEKIKISRFSQKTKAKIIISAVLVVAFVFVYALSSFGIIPLSALKARLVSNITQDNENYPIYINTDSTIRTDLMGESFVVLTTNNFSVYSNHGNLTYSAPHNYASPAISINGDRAVVFDRGDKGYMLVNEKEVVYSDISENDIICAEYGENGSFALGTKGEESTGLLTVFSKDYQVVFSWLCDYEHITGIALSEDGKYAGVAVMSAKNGEIFTTVNYFGFEFNEALNSQTISGAAAFGIEFTSFDTLTLYSDIGVFNMNRGSEKFEKIKEYYSSEFVSYDVNSKGKYVVALAKYGSTNDINLVLFSKSGKEKKVISVSETVKSVSLTDKYIFALAESSILVYNLTGEQVNKIAIEGEAYAIYPQDDFVYILSLDKISRCFSIGEETVKIVG